MPRIFLSLATGSAGAVTFWAIDGRWASGLVIAGFAFAGAAAAGAILAPLFLWRGHGARWARLLAPLLVTALGAGLAGALISLINGMRDFPALVFLTIRHVAEELARSPSALAVWAVSMAGTTGLGQWLSRGNSGCP